jgi:uncharacterized protein YeaO (DUF488 family)
MPAEESDGIRVSIMSRHTLNDGITPDLRIDRSSYDLWIKSLAPPQNLIGNYYKRGLPWKEFEEKYKNYLSQPLVRSTVLEVAKKSLEKDVTLLCVEESPDFCHRRILAEECQKYLPELKIQIR